MDLKVLKQVLLKYVNRWTPIMRKPIKSNLTTTLSVLTYEILLPKSKSFALALLNTWSSKVPKENYKSSAWSPTDLAQISCDNFFLQMYWNLQFCKVLPSLPEFILLGFVCPQQCFFKVLISSFSPMFPIHLGETILCHMYIHYKSYYFYMIQIILTLRTMSTTISHILKLSFSSNNGLPTYLGYLPLYLSSSLGYLHPIYLAIYYYLLRLPTYPSIYPTT